jgi:hypothetical protein
VEIGKAVTAGTVDKDTYTVRLFDAVTRVGQASPLAFEALDAAGFVSRVFSCVTGDDVLLASNILQFLPRVLSHELGATHAVESGACTSQRVSRAFAVRAVDRASHLVCAGVFARMLALAGLDDSEHPSEDSFLGPMAVVVSCDMIRRAWRYSALRSTLHGHYVTPIVDAAARALEDGCVECQMRHHGAVDAWVQCGAR